MAGKYQYLFNCYDCAQLKPVEREPGGCVDYYCMPIRNGEDPIYLEEYNLCCHKWEPKQIVLEV